MNKSNADYYRKVNQGRKPYLAKKARQRYWAKNKGTGKIICPNCSTACLLSLEIKK